MEGDIASFDATGLDVVVASASLQWVPDHRKLIPMWASQVNPDGIVAWQVPGNFDAPAHVLMRQLAATPEWSALLRGVLRGADSTDSAQDYAEMLMAIGLTADARETTYVHVLPGEDAVLSWVRGTALRPVLDALDDAQGSQFEAEYARLLRAAYPPTAAGTLFPFRRVFVVGRKP